VFFFKQLNLAKGENNSDMLDKNLFLLKWRYLFHLKGTISPD
jgi:hypothetical protein